MSWDTYIDVASITGHIMQHLKHVQLWTSILIMPTQNNSINHTNKRRRSWRRTYFTTTTATTTTTTSRRWRETTQHWGKWRRIKSARKCLQHVLMLFSQGSSLHSPLALEESMLICKMSIYKCTKIPFLQRRLLLSLLVLEESTLISNWSSYKLKCKCFFYKGAHSVLHLFWKRSCSFDKEHLWACVNALFAKKLTLFAVCFGRESAHL